MPADPPQPPRGTPRPSEPSSGTLGNRASGRGAAGLCIDDGWLATESGRHFRRHAIAIVLVSGLPIALLLVVGVMNPAFAAVSTALALAVMAMAVAVIVSLRLRAFRRAASARLEALQDAAWELHDRPRGDAAADAVRNELAALPMATVSHEMRAPLHGMLGLADLLAETPLSAEQQTYVRALRDSGAALARLVEDLLDASRLAAGRFALEPTPIDIEPLIEQIAELLAPRAHAKGIGLATRTGGRLPRVLVDEVRLRQILINLASNAIAFTDRGAVVLAAEAAAPSAAGRTLITFSVSDSGPGIAPADRARIFADFERASTLRGGAGLGLSISRRIVERMGGTLDLDQRLGGGSVFRFAVALPIVEATAPDRGEERLPGRRVLIVANRTLEFDTLAHLLGQAEASTAFAASPEEAQQKLATGHGAAFDAVLLDARATQDMPATVAMLRDAAPQPISIIVLIEPASRGKVEQLRGEGLDAYLIRPVRRASLTRILAEAIGSRDAFHADPLDRPTLAIVRSEGVPLRILVVEDDPVNALLLRVILQRMGHAITDAATADGARAIAGPQDFDLVFTDLHLEADDGIALIRHLRDKADPLSRLSIVAMSGAADAPTRQAALDAGADLFVEKPLQAELLRQIADSAQGRRGGA